MPHSDPVWVDWQEGRGGVWIFVYGSRVSGAWGFWERSTWDAAKQRVPTTAEKEQKANSLLTLL